MIKTIRKILIAAALPLLFASCERAARSYEVVGPDGPGQPAKPLVFRADITEPVTTGNHIETRMSGTAWGEDRIGIYMEDDLSKNIEAANKCFFTSSNGTFNALTQADNLTPTQGRAMNFYAYYPYGENVIGEKLSIDISAHQNEQEKIDVLWSDNLKAVSQFPLQQALVFNRQMARVVIYFTRGEKVSDLSQLHAMVENIPVHGELNLRTGVMSNGSIDNVLYANTQSSKDAATSSFIFLPGTRISELTVYIGDDDTMRFTLDMKNVILEKGKQYEYDVVLNDPGTTIIDVPDPVPHTGWIELPAGKPAGMENTVFSEYMLDRTTGGKRMRNFSMLYDTTHKLAYWVAYPMHSTYLGSLSRQDNYALDPNFPASQQVDVTDGGWGGRTGTGYDRGHQLPNADRTYSRAENLPVFYCTNITAQWADLNQGIWEQLESKIRNTWTVQCDTLYVVTGAMLPEGNIQYVGSGSRRAAIPEYYFKALAKRTGSSYSTIAYKIDNEDPGSSSFDSYRLTVKELETATGFTFFPAVPDAAKNTIDNSKWN